MLKSWLDEEVLISNFQTITGIDVIKLGTEASGSELKKTLNAQILISLVTTISYYKLLENKVLKKENFIFAGHSVGEVSSYHFGGILNLNDFLFTLNSRAVSMQLACDSNENTGMLAIIGATEQIITPLLKNFNLSISNINSSSQIIISGLQVDLQSFRKKYHEQFKVIELEVAGGFHSQLMREAQHQFQSEIRPINFNNPKYGVISNRDGELINDGQIAKKYLTEQITKTVRWDLCLNTLKKMQIKAILELAPGGILSGIAKKELSGVNTFAIKNYDDIQFATEFILENE